MSEVRDEILKRFQIRQTVRCLELRGDTSGNRIWNGEISWFSWIHGSFLSSNKNSCHEDAKPRQLGLASLMPVLRIEKFASCCI